MAVSPSTSGSLRLLRSDANSNFGYFHNRAGHRPDDVVTIVFQVGHVGDYSNFTSPSVVWLKDGLPSTLPPTSRSLLNNGDLQSRLTFRASLGLAGVYHCIFTDPVRSEVFLPHPVRLDISEPSACAPMVANTPAIFLQMRTQPVSQCLPPPYCSLLPRS